MLRKHLIRSYTQLKRFVFPSRAFSVIGRCNDNDTIYALCSGPLVKSGVAVIRVSGSNAFDAIKLMTPSQSRFPKSRQATLMPILDCNSKEIIDKGLVLRFDKGSSYTDEDVVEFQVHGSPAVINATLHSLSRIPSFRSAEPGEFTKRAFMNGRLSFLEVEALGDLLNAETEQQRQQAMKGMSGELQKKCWTWRSLLMRSLAHAETILDFSDDVDDESIFLADATKDLASMKEEMEQVLQSFQRNRLIKDGIRVTLCGPPNAGKSSLLNLLVGSDVAIVSSVPGTTRDVLSVDVDLEGFKVVMQDTAGLRASNDELEKEGMNRARVAVKESALRMVIVDGSKDVVRDVDDVIKDVKGDGEVIVVINKTDLVPSEKIAQLEELVQERHPQIQHVVSISCTRKKRIDELLSMLSLVVKESVEKTARGESEGLITRERQRNCLEQCVASITRCIELSKEDLVDLEAEELRNSLKCIARLTGEVDVEEILDIVFSEFCIGK